MQCTWEKIQGIPLREYPCEAEGKAAGEGSFGHRHHCKQLGWNAQETS